MNRFVLKIRFLNLFVVRFDLALKVLLLRKCFVIGEKYSIIKVIKFVNLFVNIQLTG